MDEAGLPGFYMSAWQALWVPKGTPSGVIARLNAAIVEGVGRSGNTVAARRDRTGRLPARAADRLEALGEWQKAEIAKLWPVIKSAAIKAE